jgi:hypothetical protein
LGELKFIFDAGGIPQGWILGRLGFEDYAFAIGFSNGFGNSYSVTLVYGLERMVAVHMELLTGYTIGMIIFVSNFF